jgi:ATP-dependent Zn protease
MKDFRLAVALCMGAVAATAMDQRKPVVKVTIVPCNNALGFIQRDTSRDSLLATNADREKQLEMALAGQTAEDMFCGRISNAFFGDVQHARRIVEAMQQNGDARSLEEILAGARDRIRSFLTSNEGNVRRIADALVREGELTGAQLQQVIGGN